MPLRRQLPIHVSDSTDINPLSAPEFYRFWSKVDKAGDCWVWRASLNGSGYGRFRLRGEIRYAHRLSFEIANGKIRHGLLVLHDCDNPACVRPSHLFQGTVLENIADRDSKQRQVRGSRVNTAKVTEDSVREIRSLYSSGNYSQQSLSNRFGIRQSALSSIIRRETWTHVK